MSAGSDRGGADRPPLLVVKGEASAEEVAALVAVLQSLAATAGEGSARRAPRPAAWSAARRGLRAPLAHGAGGWRASGLPR